MLSSFHPGTFIQQYKRKIFIAIILFWVVFAFLMLIENEVAGHMSKMVNDPIDRVQYIIRFTIWTCLTPLIMYIAIRVPFRSSAIWSFLGKHFVLALAIIAVEFCIEIPIIRSITANIRGSVEPVIEYAAVFVYKLNIYLLLYFFIAAMTYLVVYFDSLAQTKSQAKEAELQNQQLLMQLSEARLNLLKMQLDPHFLFNTHHAIISLMMNHENEKAITMLNKLSEMLRLSLDDRMQTVSLEKEIQILKLYLEIQQIRFEERLRIAFELDPATLQRQVPTFILQPLVENAIKYGISKTSEPGYIKIISKASADTLELIVENDGMPVDFAAFRPGIGLSNTKERLHQLYKEQATFDIKNLAGRKVAASIIIPLN